MKLDIFKILSQYQKTSSSSTIKDTLLSMVKVSAKDMIFLAVAVGLVVVFLFGGLYELLFTTPLQKWFISSLNTILNTSPQQIANVSAHIPQNTLMQKTLGDYLRFVPNVWTPLISIVTAPIDVLLGIFVVIGATVVYFGRYIGKLIPSFSKATQGGNSLGWTLLFASLLPSAIDLFLW